MLTISFSQEAADTLAKESPNTISFQMDVTKKDDIQKAFVLVSSKINDKEGLWALINNAGTIFFKTKVTFLLNNRRRKKKK